MIFVVLEQCTCGHAYFEQRYDNQLRLNFYRSHLHLDLAKISIKKQK